MASGALRVSRLCASGATGDSAPEGPEDVPGLVESARKTAISVFSVPPVEFDGMPVNKHPDPKSPRIRGCCPAEPSGLHLLRPRNRHRGEETRPDAWISDPQPHMGARIDARFGVYFVRVSGKGVCLPGIANYGVHPTVGAAAVPQVEAHVLGSCPWMRAIVVTVEWLESLRPEMSFQELKPSRARSGTTSRRPGPISCSAANREYAP